MNDQDEHRIVKKADVLPDPKRTEDALLDILILRNLDRAEMTVKKARRRECEKVNAVVAVKNNT